MSEHLGYDKHDAVGRNLGNSRNGSRTKTVLTQGRARDDRGVTRPPMARCGPKTVKKHSRRMPGVDELVISGVGVGTDHR
jgi:putative transposase